MQIEALSTETPVAASELPHPSLCDLPDALLGRVLSLLGGHEGAAGVPLACKRLSSLFFSEPAVWRTFRLDSRAASKAAQDSWRTWGDNARTSAQAAAAKRRWLAARLRLLQRQAGLVEQLQVHADYDCVRELYGHAENPQPAGSSDDPATAAVSLPAFLSSLQPGRVHTVEIFVRELPNAAVVQLPHLAPQLTRLSIDTNVDQEVGGELPASTPAALARLPQLLSLEIACPSNVTNGLVEAVGRLTQLTHLSLWCGVEAALPALPRLTRLQRLSKLRLTINWRPYEEEAEAPQLPLLARFPCLRTYRISGGGPQLAGLCPGAWNYQDGRLYANTWWGMACPLPVLADVAVPPAAPLHTIALDGGTQFAADMRRLSSRLAGLTKLSLHIVARPSLAAVLSELLPRLPRLVNLHLNRGIELREGMRDEVPAEEAAPGSYDALRVVARQRGLTHLGLWYCALPDLPSTITPCLQGLVELDLTENRLTSLPTALLAATSLRTLVLARNSGLHLTCADVARLLRAMPHLATLKLAGTYSSQQPPPAVLEFVRRAAPQLALMTS
ncbi:flightless-1-like protein [Chlorella sorokiniana]|uniref:Flightless-1-like protein n=1 Tax=Chlorella sorokiniana TaxID=3076 RepID=A0A2P6TXA2_CHLSO|nr:flightless-1-like protein [Chlorella sorokiniana]|eukprot:PRW58693.1 flightless-1-like protein [Chlorella sorokiniana]